MPQSVQRPDSVWDTGHPSTRRQIDHRHVGATRADTALTPAIARHILATYTGPGDTVCDPDPGPGLVLAEAIRVGRHAVGLQPDPRWESVLEDNLDLARLAGAKGAATLLGSVDDPRAAELPAAIDLVLTGLRHTPADNPSVLLVDLHERLNAINDWVWPGGHVVITCRPWRRHGRLLDLPGMIHEAVEATGLDPVEDCVALAAPVRGNQVRPRVVTRSGRGPDAADLRHRSAARPAHIDVFVFRSPTTLSECHEAICGTGGQKAAA
ncbi:DNA modification methylase [Amycolatopsis sacchari]|uniref:DNA modification methylase n=1 Tax=Amycolatopsis sacchari TaxID=115433 RepID=UPI003EB69976